MLLFAATQMSKTLDVGCDRRQGTARLLLVVLRAGLQLPGALLSSGATVKRR